MAVFNPQGPTTQNPEYTNVSRPISDVDIDKSGAILTRGLADLVGQATKLTDQTFKQDIDEKVYQGTDKYREGYTEALQGIRNQQIAAVQTQAAVDTTSPTGESPTLLHEENNPPPLNLQSGLQRVTQIGTALAQGGNKINDTLYTGALNSLAKELRTRYPGYRDYIDEKIKSVTGMDPANAFYRNLMEDINQGLAAQKTDVNATLATLRDLNKDGFRDVNGVTAAEVSQGVRSGQLSIYQAEKWINSSKTLEWNIKQRDMLRKERRESDADAAVNAKKDASINTVQIIQQGWDTMTLPKGTDTFAGMFKFIQENAGNQAVKDERSQAIGQTLVGLRNQMFKTAWEKATQGGENSILTKMGGDPEALKTHINGNFAVLDNAIQAVFNKDWGSAYSHMNFNRAVANDTTNLLYNAPDAEVRKYNRMVGAINQISPQASKEFFQSMLISDIPQREKEWLKTVKMEIIAQPDRESGKMLSLTQAIEKAQAVSASPKSNQELIKTVGIIGDNKYGEEHRVNVARSFFDPRINGALLSDKNFKVDYYDPVAKKQVPGKYSVFTRLSADNIATGVNELNQKHPELTPMYRETMSKEFGEQLFSREIRALGESNAASDINSPYKIKFINEKGQAPRMVFTDMQNRELTMTQAAAIRAPVAEVNRLNSGMSGLYNVYDKTGSKDATTDVLNTVYKYGFSEAKLNNVPKGWTGDFTDVPRMIWQSLMSSQQERLTKIRDRVKGPE